MLNADSLSNADDLAAIAMPAMESPSISIDTMNTEALAGFDLFLLAFWKLVPNNMPRQNVCRVSTY